MKVARALAFLLIAAASTASQAETHLQPGYPACKSQDLLMQLIAAIGREDEPAVERLSESGCSPTVAFENAGATLVDQPAKGIARVRVKTAAGEQILFTPVEALGTP